MNLKNIKLALLTACLTGNLYPALAQSTDGLNSFTEASYRKYVSEVSSDKLQGRLPFSSGETATLNYLQQQFKTLGLEPGNKGSYLQPVPMVSIYTNPDPLMKVTGANTGFDLEGLKDYVLWTRRTDARIDLKNEELVFAGFGISAPEFHHDDYAGLDVKGKIVVVLVNDPGYLTPNNLKAKP